MICTAYFGELNESRKKNWKNDDKNPYAVINMPIILERKGNALLIDGDRYFHDKIQIDWGSFGWKCTSQEIIKFLVDHKTTLPWQIKEDERIIETVRNYISERGDVSYGVVFVEEV